MEIETEQVDRSGRKAVDSLSLHVDPIQRGIGRPKYDENSDVRKQIVSQTKEFMRIRPFHNVQRKELAEFLEVTSALISYYFPEKYDLILEASSAVVMNYSSNVTNILRRDRPLLERTRDLIFEFVDFHLATGHTFDYYMHSIQRRNKRSELSLIAEQYAEILKFMEKLAAFNNQSGLQASFLQSSIWGQCMYLARQPHLQAMVSEIGRDNVSTGLAESIFNLLVNGLYGSRSEVMEV